MPDRIRNAAKAISDALLLKVAAEGTFATVVRQVAAGLMATISDLTTFHFLLSQIGLAILPASVVSFCVGLSINYLLGGRYVYRRADGSASALSAKSFFLYVGVALVSLGLTQAIVWLIAIRLGVWPLAAKFTAVPVVFLWTFWASKTLIFVESRRRPSGSVGNK